MVLIISEEAREAGLLAIGIREVRKLERAGLRLVLVDRPVLRVRPRRPSKARARCRALGFVVVLLVMLYAAKLAGATADFLRS